MRACHGDDDLVDDDGWARSSQLDMTEPEKPTPGFLRRAPLVRNRLSATNCTALH